MSWRGRSGRLKRRRDSYGGATNKYSIVWNMQEEQCSASNDVQVEGGLLWLYEFQTFQKADHMRM
jgi:hypothetical protein